MFDEERARVMMTNNVMAVRLIEQKWCISTIRQEHLHNRKNVGNRYILVIKFMSYAHIILPL